MTIMGLLGGVPFDSYFDYFNTTNKETVQTFLEGFINYHYQGDVADLVIATDNHGAHHSQYV